MKKNKHHLNKKKICRKMKIFHKRFQINKNRNFIFERNPLEISFQQLFLAK